MPQKKKLLNKFQMQIIRTLLNHRVAMTMNEIANKSELSWVTVKNYVPGLVKKGLLNEIKNNQFSKFQISDLLKGKISELMDQEEK